MIPSALRLILFSLEIFPQQNKINGIETAAYLLLVAEVDVLARVKARNINIDFQYK